MKDIVSLRNHLFEALNRLADAHDDDDLKREIDKASSIVQVSETIIRTAEVENQFIAITKGFGSGFIPVVNDKKTLLEIVKAKQESEIEEEQQYFDESKEGNWVADGGKVVQQKQEYDPLK